MPVTLLLLRHGKAERGGHGLDRERELTHRGRRQAEHIGAYLGNSGLVPGLIISSSAVRARTSAEICAAAMEYAGKLDLRDELYGISGDELARMIPALDDAFNIFLFVGHNPAFEEAASILSGQFTALGTGDCAVLSYASDSWRDLEAGQEPELLEIIRPD